MSILTEHSHQTSDSGPVELERDLADREKEARRPKADKVYIREFANHYGQEDGRYLHDLLDVLADEVEALMTLDKENGAHRNLAMVQTKITEAKHWAHEYGIIKNSLLIIDRRRFRVED